MSKQIWNAMELFKWQRMRILYDDEFPHLEGLLVWGRCGVPLVSVSGKGKKFAMTDFIVSNLAPFTKNGTGVGFLPEQVEWQGGPENFTDDVKIIHRDIWTNPKWKGGRPHHKTRTLGRISLG